ncbi:hypothetical protein M501DRAFT_1035507 [Patellaria atrata CBS 101060]|uniref:Uncharacterized protein n=1 Tax=Patellaria atrata CBS 101060 TaxID=1346257 RepID=A0A9P4S0S5_9PEZI|nr:hypothetical protein M501DRAFT_1035507 [Patellaria atrata CBS 101060]
MANLANPNPASWILPVSQYGDQSSGRIHDRPINCSPSTANCDGSTTCASHSINQSPDQTPLVVSPSGLCNEVISYSRVMVLKDTEVITTVVRCPIGPVSLMETVTDSQSHIVIKVSSDKWLLI